MMQVWRLAPGDGPSMRLAESHGFAEARADVMLAALGLGPGDWVAHEPGVDAETHYWTGDTFALRPALPDLLAEVEAGAQVDVGGFPEGAAVTAQIDGVEADAWTIGEDGRLDMTLGDAGAWEITVGEVFPTQARVYQISVIEPAP